MSGISAPQSTRRRLGEVLVEHGAITAEQLEAALEAQRAAQRERRRVRLGTLVVELGYATDRQVASALAAALSLEVVDLATITLDAGVSRLLPRSLAERHLVMPIRRADNGQVTIACADPTNVVAIDDVKVYAGVADIKIVVAAESQLRDLLARTWSLSEDSAGDVAMILEDLEDSFDDDADAESGFADAPTVRLVNTILADAVRARASDIHVEPQANAVRIRYRVDGLLRDVMTVPRQAAAGLVSRIKVMSNLDIAERRVPQDGRSRLQVDGSLLDARISTLPNIHGEKVVIRLLSRADNVPPITKVGMDELQLESLLGTLVAPQGLILITGPTGSGKTSTLYSAIHQIKTPDRNIVTLEDPVEMQVQGITQVQIHDRAGLTFARGLRSVLRQDPDVVLVGEVRDKETADLALEASLTGHLVLTTLHTNSAPAAITRLIDMGVEPFLVASSLSLVIAQRLVRRVCEICAAPYVPPPRVLKLLGIEAEDLDAASPQRGTGCADCGGTGYRGRLGVFEVLPVTAAMRAVLMSTPNEGAVAAAARAAGMQTLRSSAVAKAHAGITTYEEVLRVTQVDSGSNPHRCTACGGSLSSDMVVCPWCTTNVDRGHCEECDRPLEAAWRMCPWCRTPARGAAVVVPGADKSNALPRLLVVEDDESVRAYISTSLSGTLEVVTVDNASDALELAIGSRFDGIIVDQTLPDLSGVELIRLLRSEAHTAALPVLMLTGSANQDLETEARNAGADDYLTKPVEPALLEERALALVQRSARVGS
ncbi:MAG: type pilus assembly protein PilB [Frankiaceae bacterium]|nr:type pilus assembly protein PilB [Frankiaceae bacterium]